MSCFYINFLGIICRRFIGYRRGDFDSKMFSLVSLDWVFEFVFFVILRKVNEFCFGLFFFSFLNKLFVLCLFMGF